jgi:predicted dehydrogenase
MSLWLIGAGAMAQGYAKVLADLRRDFTVVGRGGASASAFHAATGIPARPGGVGGALAALGAPEAAIVAVGVEHLADAATALLEAGTRRLLVEKPGGLDTRQIASLHQAAAKRSAEVFVAYNRRFYASTARARELIEEDGGATSCAFEFTEWSHVIAPLARPPEVKAAWFLANSTHVVDLAFHLCGFPREWEARSGGSLAWHPSAARFAGSGITEKGVFFSYHADWEAPGRWGVEVLTRKRRILLRPLEQLHVVRQGSVTVDRMELDDALDKTYKPGLYRQTQAFLDADRRLLCGLDEQLGHCAAYDRIAGYGRPAAPARRGPGA